MSAAATRHDKHELQLTHRLKCDCQALVLINSSSRRASPMAMRYGLDYLRLRQKVHCVARLACATFH
jgi:hypothetical protein